MSYLEPDDDRPPDMPAIAEALGLPYDEGPPPLDDNDAPPDQGAPALPSHETGKGRYRSVPVGRRFAAEHLHGRWIHVDRIGWHRWDGRRWLHRPEDHVVADAATWLQRWISDMVADGQTDDEVIKYCLRYREIGNVRAVVSAARTDTRILVAPEQLDDAPGLLNCGNGVLDLRTGLLHPHDPARFFTKVASADYRPGAAHPDWGKALAALAPEAADYLRRVLGAAVTGELDRDEPATFHRGNGANGKTTILGAIAAALGDYATTVPDSILAGRADTHPTDLMTLRGARLAVLEELPEDHALPVVRLKKIVGAQEISARLIGQNFVTWRPTHHLAVSSNYHPQVTETDHGTWRRLVMIGYGTTFHNGNADPGIKRRLRGRAQQSAILGWLLSGALDWYSGGRAAVPLPEPVAEATEEWRLSSDPLGTWLTDAVEPTGSTTDRIPTSALHSVFTAAQPPGSKAWSLTKFSTRLKAHRIVVARYLGIDRGPRNRLPMALVGAVWATGAQGAQADSRDSYSTPPRGNLWMDYAHPAHVLGEDS